MTIYRAIHNKNYTTVNNTICKDKRLSWKAKGIWLYAFSRPDDWQFNISDLMNQSKDGEESVQSGLRELEKCGYLLRSRQKEEKGRFDKSDYTFYELPQELKEILPQGGFPAGEKPSAENPPLLNTDVLNTEEIKGIVLDDDKSMPLVPKRIDRQNFPLKKEQQENFDILKSLDLGCDDKTLVILIRSYKKEKIQEAITHIKHEIEKGTIFKKKKIAFLRALLADKISPVTENVIKCKKQAEKAKGLLNWQSLKISDKYVLCEKSGKEIPLNMEIKDFCFQLEKLYEISQKY